MEKSNAARVFMFVLLAGAATGLSANAEPIQPQTIAPANILEKQKYKPQLKHRIDGNRFVQTRKQGRYFYGYRYGYFKYFRFGFGPQ